MRADLWEVDTNLKVVQAPAVQDETFKGIFFCFEAVKTVLSSQSQRKIGRLQTEEIGNYRQENPQECETGYNLY